MRRDSQTAETRVSIPVIVWLALQRVKGGRGPELSLVPHQATAMEGQAPSNLSVSGLGKMAERTTSVKESLSMSRKKISSGVVHDVPADLKKALTSDPQALAAWEDITPLARNEWICWIESAKKAETRSHRIEWGRSSLRDGKRRPCCWPGCAHR